MNPTWNWLAPRIIRFGGHTPSRPCLPVMEQLEDRILLSGVPGGGDTQVLIGLLRGQVALKSSEISLLKMASEELTPGAALAAYDAFLKIETDFTKIYLVLDKASADAIRGEKHPVDALTINNAMDDVVNELKLVAPNGTGQFDQLASQIRESALKSLSDALQLLPAVQEVGLKNVLNFLKVEDAFLKLDGISDKWTTDVVNGDLTDHKTGLFMAKLDSTFLKIDNDIAGMGDASVIKLLLDDVNTLKVETLEFLKGLTGPITSPNGVANFAGLSVAAPSGDIIA